MPEVAQTRTDLTTYPYRAELETQFGDVDMLGHLNNVVIVRYYENVRVRFLVDTFGPSLFESEASYAPVLADLHVQYLYPGYFPGTVQIGLGVSRLGRSSIGLQQGLFQKGRCIGVSDTVLVLTGPSGSVPVPEEVRVRLRAMAVPG